MSTGFVHVKFRIRAYFRFRTTNCHW